MQTATAEQNKLLQSLGSKDAEIFRGNKQVDKLEKEKSALKTEIQNITVGIQHIRTELAEKEHECLFSYKSLADAEKKSARALQQIEALQKEKDVMGQELVKRCDEIRNLNEKLKLMQAALDRGKSSSSISCILKIILDTWSHALRMNKMHISQKNKWKHSRSIR